MGQPVLLSLHLHRNKLLQQHRPSPVARGVKYAMLIHNEGCRIDVDGFLLNHPNSLHILRLSKMYAVLLLSWFQHAFDRFVISLLHGFFLRLLRISQW